MKLRYFLLALASVGLILSVPYLKTATQGMAELSNPSPQQPPPSPKTAQQLATEMLQRTNLAVVTVYCGSEIGSGSIVNPNGLVLTTKHVVWQQSDIKVKTADGKTYPAWLQRVDLQNDLALVQLDTKVTLPTVPLAKTVRLKPGETIHAIGSPAGKAGTFTTGKYIGTNEHGSLKVSQGLLEPGNSGGPLLNDAGEMVGVNKGLLPDGTGLASSVSVAQKLLARTPQAK